jgi:GT2 family glycosyltransferase
MEPKVAVVILNWNGWRDTIECLESLFQVSYESMFVIVVDNGSTDDSIRRLREYCQGGTEIQSFILRLEGGTQPVSKVEYAREDAVRVSLKNSRGIDVPPKRMLTLIRNEQNYGFAEGCNIGMRYALAAVDPEYILLLNNDTVVDPGLLTEMIRVGESDKGIGILGPKILYYDFNGRNDVIWYAGGAINPWYELVFFHVGIGEADKGQYDSVEETEWCTGAALMLKRELAGTSLLNPAYTFGAEDVEFCMDARSRGYKIIYVPTAKVWHKVGASWKKLGRRIGRDVVGYFYFVKKNFSRAVYAYHVLLFIALVLPRWAVTCAMEQGDKKTLHDSLKDMKQLGKNILSGSQENGIRQSRRQL